MEPAVGTDDCRPSVEETFDAYHSLARRHERIPRHAGITRVDPSIRRTRVPFVDRRIELHTRISAGPGGVGDLIPKVAGFQRLARFQFATGLLGPLLLGAPVEMPRTVLLHCLHKVVGDAYR